MKLKEVCKYRKEKINVSNIDTSRYISTDNMETNFGGFVQTKTFPKVGNVDRFYKGDILLSNIRPYFKKMIYSDFDNGCSSDVLVFNVDKDKVDSKYMYYRMMCNDFFDYVILTSKGTKMPRGDKNAIMEFEFDLPDMDNQRKIVNILNIINEKVRENTAINNNLLFSV